MNWFNECGDNYYSFGDWLDYWLMRRLMSTGGQGDQQGSLPAKEMIPHYNEQLTHWLID